ncbi:MAG: GNAT family N-acetyltransferase [Bacteroidales bacterium]|nr:GNAT family N-acetyltransferase [Bacteroidales bacterium]
MSEMRSEIEIRRYVPADCGVWDEFVDGARNSTFLFRREYMDYHADRFEDFSLMAFREGKLCALLPADVTPDGVLHSHRGLSYGGWILPKAHLDGTGVLRLFENTIDFCHEAGISALDYKALPSIYASYPSQEDIYALFRLGAIISETTLSSTVDLRNPLPFNKLQRRMLRKAEKLNPGFVSSPLSGEWDVTPFWEMLAICLSERHGAVPVHSCSELSLLYHRFPRNIRFFMAISPVSGLPAAGVCMFVTESVVHCQYICTTEEGRDRGLLPWLFDRLIHNEYALSLHPEQTQRWFDFGTSNEDGGRVLNEGLLRQKFSLGGTGVACQRFLLEIPS